MVAVLATITRPIGQIHPRAVFTDTGISSGPLLDAVEVNGSKPPRLSYYACKKRYGTLHKGASRSESEDGPPALDPSRAASLNSRLLFTSAEGFFENCI